MANLPPFLTTFKFTANMSTPSTTALQPAGDCFPDRSAHPTRATDPDPRDFLAEVEAELYSANHSMRFAPRARIHAPTQHIEVPFAPGLHNVRMNTVWVNGRQVLEATVALPSRRVCNYAVDPQVGVVTFVVTRRWSVPGKPQIVGGAVLPFPRRFNWDVGTVVDSGEHTAVWVCRWPKMGEQLAESKSVVDVCVEEGDYWFGLDAEGERGA